MTDAELTRLAAERVMGWHYWDFSSDYDGPVPMFTMQDPDDKPIAFYYGDSEEVQDTFSPLTDWRAAGEIIEKMRALGFRFELEDRHRPTICFRAYFKSYDEFFLAIENTDRRAIVMAALRAVGAVGEEGGAR